VGYNEIPMTSDLRVAVLVRFVFLLTMSLSVARSQAPEQKRDALIVYGENFSFGVKEPTGWRADTSDLARQYHVNVAFVKVPEEPDSAHALIRVRISAKQDENTIEDLNYDMDQYRKGYLACQFGELRITHPEYKTFAKLVFVPKRFYEYVAYLNPGPETHVIFSVAMSKQSSPATEAELTAYQTVLRSLQWLTSSVATKP
jgi:hypothetical protein